ncbi:MAG: hypothetical protein WBA77_13650 [Microcoleaceae cyanobacterium]
MTNNTEIQRLHRLIVWGRWVVVILLWITVAPLSLRQLQPEIALWRSHFTWTAVRYGLAHHRLATVGLSLCIGLTTAVLVWQSRNILMGFPPEYQKRLEKQVRQIRQQGSSHPLWKWVIHHSSQNSSTNSLE